MSFTYMASAPRSQFRLDCTLFVPVGPDALRASKYFPRDAGAFSLLRSLRPMLNIISTAANAMAVQSQRLEAVAQAIASTRPTVGPTPGAPGTPVRIGALPLGDAIENIATLAEVELAYRANAAVIGTALVMIDTLLELVEPDCDEC
jgi:hypothetical protein